MSTYTCSNIDEHWKFLFMLQVEKREKINWTVYNFAYRSSLKLASLENQFKKTPKIVLKLGEVMENDSTIFWVHYNVWKWYYLLHHLIEVLIHLVWAYYIYLSFIYLSVWISVSLCLSIYLSIYFYCLCVSLCVCACVPM